MLLNFKVKNYKSFADKQTLSATVKEGEIANILAIYGANSSGKSNLFEALRCFIENIELMGYFRGNIRPYLFDNHVNQPTSFEAEVVIGDKKYCYSYTFHKEVVLEEYLYDYSETQEQKVSNRIFSRVLNNDSGSYEFDVKKEIEDIIETYLSENKQVLDLYKTFEEGDLFLSYCVHKGIKISKFLDIYNYLTSYIFAELDDNSIDDEELKFFIDENPNSREDFLKILQTADSTIKNFEFREIKSTRRIRVKLKNAKLAERVLKNDLLGDNEIESFETKIIETSHWQLFVSFEAKGMGEDLLMQDNKYEQFRRIASAGTQKMLYLCFLIYKAHVEKSVLIIDELDNNLHIYLAQFLLDLVKNPYKDMQLIFTSHNPRFLNFLDENEILFIKRDKNNYSEICYLIEYDIPKSSDKEKMFLKDAFGINPEVLKIKK